jgi:hypothetical protein
MLLFLDVAAAGIDGEATNAMLKKGEACVVLVSSPLVSGVPGRLLDSVERRVAAQLADIGLGAADFASWLGDLGSIAERLSRGHERNMASLIIFHRVKSINQRLGVTRRRLAQLNALAVDKQVQNEAARLDRSVSELQQALSACL